MAAEACDRVWLAARSCRLNTCALITLSESYPAMHDTISIAIELS